MKNKQVVVRSGGASVRIGFLFAILIISTDNRLMHADPVSELCRNFPAIPRGSLEMVCRETYADDGQSLVEFVNRYELDEPYFRVYYTTKYYKDVTTQKLDRVHYGQGLLAPDLMMSNSMDGPKSPGRELMAWVKPYDVKLARSHQFNPHSYATHGYLRDMGFMSLEELFAISSKKFTEEQFNSTPVTRLEAKSTWGVVTFWLDPKQNYLPLKCTVRKGPDDLIDEDRPLRGRPDPQRPHVPYLTEYVIEYETRKIERFARRPMMTSYIVKRSFTNTLGESSGDTQNVILRNIKVVDAWPSPPREFFYPLPEGSRVHPQDDREIRYKWVGGKVVKDIDPKTVEALDQAQLSPERSPPHDRRILWWGGVLVLVGILLWLWRRQAKGQR